MKNIVTLCILMTILNSCGQASFKAATKTIDKSSTLPAPTIDHEYDHTGIKPPQNDPDHLQLTINSTQSAATAQFLFVMDTSLSMHDDLDKLKLSLTTLIDRVNQAGVEFKSRFITMHMLEQSLGVDTGADGAQFMSPRDAYWYLGNVPVYGNTSNLSVIKQQIHDLQQNLTSNEPGICTALVHLQNAENYGDRDDIHIVVLSDEDNTRKIQTQNQLTGAVEQSYPLSCPVVNKQCEYCYSYNEYTYSGTYKAKGTCEAQGFGETEDLFRLIATNAFVTKQYSCIDNQVIKDWSCHQQPSDTPTIIQRPLSKEQGSDYRYCERAKYYQCKKFIDGVQVTDLVAANQVSNQQTCSIDWSQTDWVFEYFGATKAEYYRNCSSCTQHTYQRSSVLEAGLDPSRYSDCQLQNDKAGVIPALQATYSGSELSSINNATCPAYYQTVSMETTIAQNICQSQIKKLQSTSAIPAAVRVEKTGISKPIEINFNESYSYQMSLQEAKSEIARRNGWNENLVTITHEKITQVKGACFAEQRFTDVGNKTRQQKDFHETSCNVSETFDTKFEPTPETFMQLAPIFRPKNKIYWHSIVNQDGKFCNEQTEGNISRGTDYLSLSQKTDGIVESVCEPNFHGFMNKLSDKVVNKINLRYDLGGRDPSAITMVRSLTRNVDLAADKDYKTEHGAIVFSDQAVRASEVIYISFE